MTLVADFNASVNVPFQRIRTLLAEGGGGLQEGVAGATDLKVAQRGAGANMSVDVPAGAAWVQIDTGTRNGLGHVFNDATANVTVTASNATNPRIDQIVLRWNDTSIPTGAGNVPTLETLAGTATAGATLDNRTGAAALPNDCLRLADILVPAASTSVVTANIRDRRPWARGAHRTILRTSNAAAGADYSTAATGFVDIDTVNLQPRIECSGVPVLVSLRGQLQSGNTLNAIAWRLVVDGTPLAEIASGVEGFTSPSATTLVGFNNQWEFAPAAGSHLIRWQFQNAGGTVIVRANSAQALQMSVDEIIKPNADNT